MKYLLLSIIIFTAVCFPLITLADTGLVFTNPVTSIGNKTPATIVGNAIKVALGIIGSISLVLFIYAGAVWMVAKGDAAKIKQSTSIMAWTAIGLLVVFSSYILLSFVFDII